MKLSQHYRKFNGYRYVPLVGSLFGKGKDYVWKAISIAIMVFAAVSIVSGMVLFRCNEVLYIPVLNWGVFYITMILSILLHEVFRIIAVFSGNCSIFDAGLLFWGFLPIGTYISPFYEDADSRSAITSEIYKYIVGCSSLVMIAGISLIVSFFCKDPQISYTFIVCFKVHLILALINGLPSFGDGQSVLRIVMHIRKSDYQLKSIKLTLYNSIRVLSNALFIGFFLWLWIYLFRAALNTAYPAPFVRAMLERI